MALLSAISHQFRPRDQVSFGWGRVDAFIDAVYAIAATLLVLELRPPHAPEGHLARALLDQWPVYFIYFLGFMQIVGGWCVLRRVSVWSVGIDHYGMLLVMFVMLTYSLAPFTFSVLSDATGNAADFTAGVRLLATVLTISMVAFSGFVAYQRWRGYIRGDLHPDRMALVYLLCTTAFLWPLSGLLLTFVAGGWGLVPIASLTVLSLLPVEALPPENR